MDQNRLNEFVIEAVRLVLRSDHDLLNRDNSERCIAARLAHHLQNCIARDELFLDWFVDVEFNRQGGGGDSKLLGRLNGCARKFTPAGQAYVTPDLIVHKRGPRGPNLFVAEVKKSTNDVLRDCDRRRIESFCEFFHYQYGALVDFETRPGIVRQVKLTWFKDGTWEEIVAVGL